MVTIPYYVVKIGMRQPERAVSWLHAPKERQKVRLHGPVCYTLNTAVMALNAFFDLTAR